MLSAPGSISPKVSRYSPPARKSDHSRNRVSRAAARRSCRTPCLRTSRTSPSGAASASAQMKLARLSLAPDALQLLARHALHGKPKSFVRSTPARRMDTWLAAERLDLEPELSARAGRPRLCAAATAFSSAFSAKLAPVSSGSGKPSSPRETISMPMRREQLARSRAPCPVVAGDDEPVPRRKRDAPLRRR